MGVIKVLNNAAQKKKNKENGFAKRVLFVLFLKSTFQMTNTL